MPSLVTHYIFGKEVLDKIDNKYVDTNKYLLFNQSHDYLYHTKKKIYRDLAKKGHHYKTKDFIINIIEYIKDNKLENDKDVISFLYGIINHYVLDSTCHPIIFYYGGSYRKGDKNTEKYRGMHAYIERNIDLYMYEKSFNKSYKCSKLDKEFFEDTDISDSYDIINYAYSSTYGVKDTAVEYQKCINKMKRFNKFIVRDKTGIKHFFYNLVDKVSCKHFGILSCYSTCIKKDDSFMNNNHETWYHPVTKEKHNESFIDLYNESIKKSLKILKSVNKVLYDNKEISYLDDYVEDLDYANGLHIKKGTIMKCFRY